MTITVLKALSAARLQMFRQGFYAALGGCTLIVALYLARLHSYLLFHGFAEVFSIIVAGGIFMVAWNSRQFLNQSYFLTLGVAFLCVAFIDLFHMLAYRGMGVFAEQDGNLAIQLWLAARWIQALSFAVAPLFLCRRVAPVMLFASYGGLVALLLSSILHWKVFPDCFIQGVGLTQFKIASEYLICLVLFAALGLHWKRRSAFDPLVLRLVIAALLVSVASELAFTLYVNVYGPANLIGHFLKVIAFYLIYRAFVQMALTKPYQLMFLELKRTQEAMHQSQARLEAVHRELQASFQQLAEDETAARRIQFLLLPPPRMVCQGCEFQSTIHTSAFLSGDFVDYFPINCDHAGFYIADVSGHGVSSAFITVLLKSAMVHLLEEHKQGKDDLILRPDAVLGWLNHYLLEQQLGKYLTMFYAILNTRNHQLIYSNAGQFPNPILMDAQGTRALEQKAMPVGLFPQAVHQTIRLGVSDRFSLALFSDGVLDVLPQGDLGSKQDYLLAQVAADNLNLDQLEASLGIARIQAPLDDVTVMLLKCC